MAKRMKSKIQPAEMTMTFPIRTVEADEDVTHFIDLSQCASLVNRRFYRQGLNWGVSNIKVRCLTQTTPVHCEIQIQRLPNTWVMSNAWEKGFRAWMQMNKEALEEAPSVKPKFLDFKIYANDKHHEFGYSANLLPCDANGNITTTGEWESSKLRIPVGVAAPGDTTEREIIAVGANYPGAGASGVDAVSLIEGYASSRGLPNVLDPNTPGDADDASGTLPQNWISALQSEGTEQDAVVLNDLITENNIAPYPFENDGIHTDTMYPGGANQLPALAIHDESALTGTTIGSVVHFQGGNFPCGLMGIRFNNFLVFDPETGLPYENTIQAELQITLVPGTHRGYLAESMTEM